MIQPPDHELSLALAVRDGRRAPVTCAACGCRLEGVADRATFRHFNPLGGRDARGCRVACADLVHDAGGRPLAS